MPICMCWRLIPFYISAGKTMDLKKRLEFCVDLFMDRIYDPSRKHFNLFFDNEWNSLVEMDSYGHDVETGWLLCEAARTLEDRRLDGYRRIGLHWM